MTKPSCKDCGSTTRRLNKVGERTLLCVTCIRERKKRTSAAAHAARIQTTYGITDKDYQAIYELQEGLCAICRRATGATRRLSVDHNHATGEVRGLLCRPCNNMLGHVRDDYHTFYLAIMYLTNPPARRLREKND